jgi:hypothetical protein
MVGFPCDQPVELPFGGRPDLDDWKVLQAGASFEDQQLVQWQYEAACAIHGQVSARAGRERMQRAIAVLLAGRSPYDLLAEDERPGDPGDPSPASTHTAIASSQPPRLPPGEASATPEGSAAASAAPGPASMAGAAFSDTPSSKRRTRPVDWRQWLDIMDEVALVPAGISDLTFAEDLLVETGVVRRRAVRGRADARAAFHDLRSLAPSGVTPALVRRSLDAWDFADATRDIGLARQVVERLVAAGDAPEVAGLWAEYEAASSRAQLRRLRDRLP